MPVCFREDKEIRFRQEQKTKQKKTRSPKVLEKNNKTLRIAKPVGHHRKVYHKVAKSD